MVVFSLERLLVISNPIYFMGRFSPKTATAAVAVLVFAGILKSLQVFLNYFVWLSTATPANRWVEIRSARYPWLAGWATVQSVVTVILDNPTESAPCGGFWMPIERSRQ